MLRYCPNCGTEVDETALFCPTCGSPIDEEAETQLPPAPAWPEPDEASWGATRAAPPREEPPSQPVEPAVEPIAEPPAEPARPRETAPDRPMAAADDEPWVEEPTRAEPRPAAAAAPPPVQPPPASATVPRPRGGTQDRPTVDLPFSMPVMLSGWLIGGGALLAALGLIIGMFTHALIAIDLVLLVALLGVAATVFLAASMPEVPHLRLVILAVLLVGFGMGLDRLLIRPAGVDVLLLFLGTAAAAIGAILVEVGKDAPVGSPRI
jgi:hypothetical protein